MQVLNIVALATKTRTYLELVQTFAEYTYSSPNRFYSAGRNVEKGTVRLGNPNIQQMDQDILYHLALDTNSHDLVEMFGDVQFVCMGGTTSRMEKFAHFIMKEIGYKLLPGTQLMDISHYSYRYCMYKVGPVLSISHGMGAPSMTILLHETIKLMYHAKCKNPILFRIGTSGGIGIKGGTVVVSEDVVDGLQNRYYKMPVLGKLIKRPAMLDKNLARELQSLTDPDDSYEIVTGTTMCTDDFYEGQGRLDGAFCEFTDADKMKYLERLQKLGIKNIEMESIPFAALTHHACIRAAIICVTLLDRLKGDQVNFPIEWENRPQELVARYIKNKLSITTGMCCSSR